MPDKAMTLDMIAMLEAAAQYITNLLGQQYAGHVRHAVALAVHPIADNTHPARALAECQRYAMLYDDQLPENTLARCQVIAHQVARTLGCEVSEQLRAMAVAVGAQLPRIPAGQELDLVERELFGGETPYTNSTWQPTACTITRQQLREELSVATPRDMERVLVAMGLHRVPVENPAVQHIHDYDLLAGHSDAIPVLNADTDTLIDDTPIVEQLRLRLRENKTKQPAARGRDADAKLRKSGIKGLHTAKRLAAINAGADADSRRTGHAAAGGQ